MLLNIINSLNADIHNTLIIGLLQNTAILLSLSLLYGSVWLKFEPAKPLMNKVITGIVIGCIAILLMQTPWTFVPGIVFDTRSVLLAISGFFFGGIPTAVAILIAGGMRVIIGGDGMWMGLAVIISSGAIGVMWKYFKPVRKKYQNKPINFLLLGLSVHLIVLACTAFLPSISMIPTFMIIIMPLLLIYTPATMLLGMLMIRQKINNDNRNATAKLKESEEKFRNIFENHSAVKLIIYPETGDIIDANHAASRFYGWTREELKKMKIGDINTLQEDKLKIEIQKVLNQTHNFFEFRHKMKNGSVVDVETFSSRIDISGKTYLHSIIHDVSEKQQLMKDLVAAKEKAEESDKLKTLFLMNMSHEIRTPLNGILGFASILIENPNEPVKTVEYSHIIKKSGERLHSLINDMIDISRIESGLEKTQIEKINAQGALYEAVQQFSAQAALKNIEINTSFPDKGSSVYINTDARKLHQIFSNLINNAIKFSEKGTIEAGFRLENGNIIFYVKDEGIGIAPEHHEQVFHRFFQTENPFILENPGTGLGLTICKGLVKLLDGNIWLESEPGKGSIFYVTLPLQKGLD